MLSNKVREIASREVVTVGVRDKIFNVMKTMAKKNLGAVVVMEKDEPVGVFTEQDVLKRVIMGRLDTRKSDVKWVMTTPIRAVGEESHIIRALEAMYRGKSRHLLIHGEKHVVVGIISMRDILKMGVGLQHYLVEDKTIGSIVGKKQLKVDIRDPVYEAVRLMLKENRGSVAVLRDGELKGIFTDRDLLRRVAVKKVDIKKTPMRKVMTADPVSVNLSTPIGEVLGRMYEGDFRNIPVLGDAGNLVGVVSMGDVLKYIKGLDVDGSVRKTWKEIKEFWDSYDQYTPG